MQKLSLDIQTFRKLRELNYVYVDKTKYAYNLITGGQCYFLARPRRFGKSLFVSTLQEVLSGNKKIFDGLWISKSDYVWQEHGVIVLDFSAVTIDNIDAFKKNICTVLQEQAEAYGLVVAIDPVNPKMALRAVVMALHKKFGRVAILIDEYDYPILRSLHDQEYAIKIRDIVSDFYVTFKALDASINFVFITGVSSFSKAGIFSGLNNLRIISLSDDYGAVLGCTDEEVGYYFKEYMQAWAENKNISYQQLRKEIKEWYNGYHFGDNVPAVYNPFSLMNALQVKKFENFWVQSGTPSFLIKEINQEYRNEEFRIFDIKNLRLNKDDLGTIDVGAIPLPSLFFQAGYLTIDTYDEETKLYALKFPNLETKQSFQQLLFNVVTRVDVIACRNYVYY